MQKSYAKLSIILLMQAFSMSSLIADVQEIQTLEEYKSLTTGGQPVVVKFYADWCGACKDAKAPYEELSNDPDLTGIKFTNVNTDKVQVDDANIEALPTVVTFKDGKMQDKSVGFTKENIKGLAQKLLANGTNQNVDAATASVENKDGATASAPSTEAPKPESAPAHHEGGLVETIKNFVVGIFMTVKNMLVGIFDWIKSLFGK